MLPMRQSFHPAQVSVRRLVAFFIGDICNSYVLAKMKVVGQGSAALGKICCIGHSWGGVNTILFYGIGVTHGVTTGECCS